MSSSRWLSVACAGGIAALTSVAPVRTQEQGFWSFFRPGQVVRRCAVASAAHKQAQARFEALDHQIEKLAVSDSFKPVVEDLHGLLRTECFWLASEANRVPKPDSAAALKAWWSTAGGREWLAGYLEASSEREADSLPLFIVVPPDFRKTLHLEGHEDHPLKSFLCPAADPSCGAATRGWRVRAEAHFAAHPLLPENRKILQDDDRAGGDADQIARACGDVAAAGDKAHRYQLWRECVESRTPKTVALPLGDFKPPDAGWLIVSGRRGHYEFCDSTRAYDLASGAAFVSDSCSGLVLKRNGRVDVGATNEKRVNRVAAGTLSVDNLREAAWMMLFRGETEEVQLDGAHYPLPAGLVPELRVRRRAESWTGRSISMNTSQTLLVWRWLPPSGDAITGELTWPASYEAAEDHAAKLLDIAEQSLAEGCTSKELPPAAAIKAQRTITLNDVGAEWIADFERDVAAAFDTWKALPVCRPQPR